MHILQTHPFSPFTPPGSTTLILGSFSGREAFPGSPTFNPAYDWYYGTSRNQFWPILEQVYGYELKTIKSKQELFARLHIAIADIIYCCRRKKETSSDSDLLIIEYNAEIPGIILSNPITRILFTSRFVEKKFRDDFKDAVCRRPEIEMLTLPSPSPRYARMSREKKILKYRELLPELPPGHKLQS